MWQTENWLKKICWSAGPGKWSLLPLVVTGTVSVQTPHGLLCQKCCLAGITSHSSTSLHIVHVYCDVNIYHLSSTHTTGRLYVHASKYIPCLWLILQSKMQMLLMYPENIPIPLHFFSYVLLLQLSIPTPRMLHVPSIMGRSLCSSHSFFHKWKVSLQTAKLGLRVWFVTCLSIQI